MNFNIFAEHFLNLELMKANIKIFQNQNGKGSSNFIIKTKTDDLHELRLHALYIDKESSIKIPKTVHSTPKKNVGLQL